MVARLDGSSNLPGSTDHIENHANRRGFVVLWRNWARSKFRNKITKQGRSPWFSICRTGAYGDHIFYCNLFGYTI